MFRTPPKLTSNVSFQKNIISSFFPLMTHLMFVFSNSGRLHRHFHQSKRCRGKNLPHDVPVKIKSTFIIIGLSLYYKRLKSSRKMLYRDGNQNKTWFSEAIFELNRTKAFKLVTGQALKIAYCQTLYWSHKTSGNNSKQSFLCLFLSVCFHAVHKQHSV